MKLQPLYPMIVIAPDKEEESPSGIILPDLSKEPPSTGTITAVYDGIENDVDLRVGDRIQWKKLSGIEVDDLILLDVANALCKLQARQVH